MWPCLGIAMRVAIILGALCVAPCSLAQVKYRVIDLGVTPDWGQGWSFAVSSKGLVVGQFEQVAGRPGGAEAGRVGFIWGAGALSRLALPPGASEAQPAGLNDKGEVAGAWTRAGKSRIALWREGKMLDLGPGAATGISSKGHVVGVRADGEAFIWERGKFKTIPVPAGASSILPLGVNASGQVVGKAVAGDRTKAFLWKGRESQILPSANEAAGYMASAISDQGTIAGLERYNGAQQAVVWEGGRLVKLGRLDGATTSAATDVNNNGQVVGTSGGRAFLYENRTLSDLSKRLDFASQDYVLVGASSISNNGLIAAQGGQPDPTRPGRPVQQRALLLVPVGSGVDLAPAPAGLVARQVWMAAEINLRNIWEFRGWSIQDSASDLVKPRSAAKILFQARLTRGNTGVFVAGARFETAKYAKRELGALALLGYSPKPASDKEISLLGLELLDGSGKGRRGDFVARLLVRGVVARDTAIILQLFRTYDPGETRPTREELLIEMRKLARGLSKAIQATRSGT